MAAAPRQTIRVELPRALPAGATLHLWLRPRTDAPKEARLILDSGGETTFDAFAGQDTTVDGSEQLNVEIRVPGEYSIGAWLRIHDQTAALRTEPGSVTLPMAGELVVQVADAELARALAAPRK